MIPASLCFTAPGNPQPKERPRTFLRGGRAVTITPERTREAERHVRECAMSAALLEGHVSFTGPVAVSCIFFRGDERRCDIDNLVKVVLDAINGLAYVDDSQIRMIAATKLVDKAKPRTFVAVTELPAECAAPRRLVLPNGVEVEVTQ
jgi:Holliday junction resolvase RusA-like endonuclease